jgi:hypothetical protein
MRKVTSEKWKKVCSHRNALFLDALIETVLVSWPLCIYLLVILDSQ